MTTNIIKYILLTIMGLLSSSTMVAQYQQEIQVGAGLGLSTLQYKTEMGKRNGSVGGTIAGGYTYFLLPSFGIRTGAELTLYNAQTKVNYLYDSSMAIDPENVTYELRSRLIDYKETQLAFYANIPIMFQYQQNIGKYQVYAAIGGKFGIPVKGQSRTSGATIKKTGYYSEFEPEYETQEFLGFGVFQGKKVNQSISFGVSYMASAELGLKWDMGNNKSMYTGIYLDYGLNDIQKKRIKNDFIVSHSSNPRDFSTNSVIYSKYKHEGKTGDFTNKIKTMAVGLKVSVAFGKKAKPRKREEIDVAPVQVNKQVKDSVKIQKTEVEDIALDIHGNDTVYIIKEIPAAVVDKTDGELILNRNLGQLDALDELNEPLFDRIILSDLTPQFVNESRVDTVYKTKTDTVYLKDDISKAKNIITGDISGYAVNRTELTPAMKKELDVKIEEMKKYPNFSIYLEGNTCSLGGSAYNRRLGWERAEKVREYLIKQGIDQRRISVVSYGKWDPEQRVENTEADRRRNRRVEISVSER